MSTKPRTPEYFPRMKVRGGRRRKIAATQRAIGRMHRAGAALGVALRRLGESAQIVAIRVNALPLSKYTIVD